MTETAALITATRPGQIQPGSCGEVLSIGKLRLSPDGEILYQGPNLFFSGYFRDPESSAAALDDDGFLRTGDLGHLDASGFLTVRGRKKELLVTSGGKNVAPSEVEPPTWSVGGGNARAARGGWKTVSCRAPCRSAGIVSQAGGTARHSRATHGAAFPAS